MNWSANIGKKSLPGRGAAYEIHDDGDYERFAVELIKKSDLSAVVGDCKDLARHAPMTYQTLIGASRVMAMFEVGEVAGITPPEASSDAFSKMLTLLDSCVAENPAFSGKTELERQQISHEATLQFKDFCRCEIVDPNGMIACALKKGIGKAPLLEPAESVTAR